MFNENESFVDFFEYEMKDLIDLQTKVVPDILLQKLKTQRKKCIYLWNSMQTHTMEIVSGKEIHRLLGATGAVESIHGVNNNSYSRKTGI